MQASSSAPPASPFPPVEGLRDIVQPEPVHWLPPAPGWYVLAGLLLLLAAWACRRHLRHRAANLYRRQALAELDGIAAALDGKSGPQELALRLPALLKRVALHVEPRAKVAALTDAEWLAQLDRMYGGQDFSQGPGRILPDLAYGTTAAVSQVSKSDLDALVRLSRRWITRHRAA